MQHLAHKCNAAPPALAGLWPSANSLNWPNRDRACDRRVTGDGHSPGQESTYADRIFAVRCSSRAMCAEIDECVLCCVHGLKPELGISAPMALRAPATGGRRASWLE